MLTFNIGCIIVVVNKMDAVNYDKAVFGKACKYVGEMLKQTGLAQSKLVVKYIPVAGLQETDNNLMEYSPKMSYAQKTLSYALLSIKRKPVDLN